jgi:DNA-binding MarR family transcriptional regulator
MPGSRAPSRMSCPQTMDDLLLYRLSRLTATAGTMVVRICEGRYGITRREWRVVALLGQEENLMSSQLAERIQLDRARTSRAITSLVSKQLLHRQQGPADRREARMALTAAGRSLYDALMPEVQRINRDILAVLDADAVADLDEALQRLQERSAELVSQTPLPKADRRRGGRSTALLG